MSHLLRLSQTCLMEFSGSYSKKLTEKELYAYRFNNNVQLLSKDGDLNDRDHSYCPYFQNVLLRTTPSSYFTQEFHDSSALSKLVSKSCPALEYNKATVNFAAGWQYNADQYMSGIRLYYIIDGVFSFTVCALVDEKSSSRIKVNKRKIVLDNVEFNQSFDVEYLNVAQLFNSIDPDIKALREHMFGVGDHKVSELFVEQFVINKEQIAEFYAQNSAYPFQRFYINDLNKQFYTKDDTDSQLFVSFKRNDTNSCISMQLLHTKYNIRTYLESMLSYGDSWSIAYELTTTAYNSEGNELGSLSVKLSDFADPFNQILYRPIILNEWLKADHISKKIDHCVFDLRCIATSNLAQLEITRYAQIVEINPERYVIGIPNVEMVSPVVYSRKEVVTHEVKMQTDLPNIVKIIQPYYVMSAVGDTITLLPYTTNVAVPLEAINLQNATKLSLRFDTREYVAKEFNSSRAIFQIPPSEYAQSSKTWYMFDDNDNLITYGKVVRNGQKE